MMKVPLFPPPPPKIRKAAVIKKGTAAQRLLRALDKQQETAEKRYKRQRELEAAREKQRLAHEYVAGEPAQEYRNRIFQRDQLATTIRRPNR